MARLNDWEQRLFTFLNSRANAVLEFGTFDCAIGLASGAVEAQTGVNPFADFLNAYDSEASGLRLLMKEGFASQDDERGLYDALARAADSFLPRAERKRRGNILLLETEEGVGFAVRTGGKAVALVRTGGLRELDVPSDSLEWSVS